MSDYYLFALAMLAAQLSPGPDFLLVLKNGLNHHLSTALCTVAGIGAGIVVHATLATAGLSMLLATSKPAYRIVLVAGGLYLLWIATGLLRSVLKKSPPGETPETAKPAPGNAAAFREGLITNLLNPKVVLFFSSMLAQFLKPDSPPIDRIIYPAIIIVEGIIVWCMIAWLLQIPAIKRGFFRFEKPINAVFAALLFVLAAGAFMAAFESA